MVPMKIKAWIVALLLAVSGSFGVESAAASSVDGTWVIQDLILNIFDCQNLVCGRIVWIKDPARRPSECGQTIVWGLASTGPAEWTGGSILDPDDGKIYRLAATLQPDGTLHARIYKGVPLLGQTKILRRTDLRSVTGQC
jgi:uncharacterized protein (DUF2147 family)